MSEGGIDEHQEEPIAVLPTYNKPKPNIINPMALGGFGKSKITNENTSTINNTNIINPMAPDGFGKSKITNENTNTINNTTAITQPETMATIATENTQEQIKDMPNKLDNLKSNEDEIISIRENVAEINPQSNVLIEKIESTTPRSQNHSLDLGNFVESQKHDGKSKTGSKKSSISSRKNNNNNTSGGGVNPLIIKGLQDKVEGISSKIDDI